MSARTLRWVLWIGFVLFLPLPYNGIQSGRIPAVQLFLFTGLVGPLMVTDLGLTSGVLGTLFTAQSLLYGIGLWYAARWISRRVPPPRRTAVLLATGGALLAITLLPVYVAPLSAGPEATTWWRIWP